MTSQFWDGDWAVDHDLGGDLSGPLSLWWQNQLKKTEANLGQVDWILRPRPFSSAGFFYEDGESYYVRITKCSTCSCLWLVNSSVLHIIQAALQPAQAYDTVIIYIQLWFGLEEDDIYYKRRCFDLVDKASTIVEGDIGRLFIKNCYCLQRMHWPFNTQWSQRNVCEDPDQELTVLTQDGEELCDDWPDRGRFSDQRFGWL